MATNSENKRAFTPFEAAFLLASGYDETSNINLHEPPIHTTSPDPARNTILSHSSNPVHHSAHKEEIREAWFQRFPPIARLVVRTRDVSGGRIAGDFDEAFLPDYGGERYFGEPAGPATESREWHLKTETDCEAYFLTEISSVVVPALAKSVHEIRKQDHYLADDDLILRDANHIAYRCCVKQGLLIRLPMPVPVVIGVSKLREINRLLWQSGDISSSESQMNLSRELRGYAHGYKCPQIFCFDGDTLLLLQFRALQPSQLLEDDCPVDCWDFPRDQGVISLRDALHRLILQGRRRCVGNAGKQSMRVGGVQFFNREFYNGHPLWEGENGVQTTSHPGGWERSTNDLLEFWWTMEGQEPRTEDDPGSRFWD